MNRALLILIDLVKASRECCFMQATILLGKVHYHRFGLILRPYSTILTSLTTKNALLKKTISYFTVGC